MATAAAVGGGGGGGGWRRDEAGGGCGRLDARARGRVRPKALERWSAGAPAGASEALLCWPGRDLEPETGGREADAVGRVRALAPAAPGCCSGRRAGALLRRVGVLCALRRARLLSPVSRYRYSFAWAGTVCCAPCCGATSPSRQRAVGNGPLAAGTCAYEYGCEYSQPRRMQDAGRRTQDAGCIVHPWTALGPRAGLGWASPSGSLLHWGVQVHSAARRRARAGTMLQGSPRRRCP